MNLNFSGVWKGNLEKSKLLGPTPKVILVKINHADPELVVEMVITKMDDTEDRVLFRGLTNGEEVANSVHGIQVRSRSTSSPLVRPLKRTLTSVSSILVMTI